MKDSVRLWIDGGVQPVLLVVDPDRFLIDRNAIRTLTVSWLEIDFLNPVVNGDTTPLDTKYLKYRDSIRKLEFSEMQLNTELHQQSRCRFASNKLKVDLI